MPYPLTTTLARIKAAHPCPDGWARALAATGKAEADDEPILFSKIINAVGIEDALWCCRAEPQHSREWRLFAVWCARQVQHLMTDQRSLDALNIAERHANDLATDKELDAASAGAWAAAWDAASAGARDAASAGAWAGARDAQRNAFVQICTDGTLPTA